MVFLLAPLVAAMAPAAAQDRLPVKPGKPWTHAHSGITIPAALDELPRVRATSFAAPELEISQNFASEDGRQSLTLSIFRDTNGAVPLWFAQAQRAIILRADLKNPVLAVPPRAFTPPGQGAASGLKAVYAPTEVEGIKSTGVALFEVGDWYVKLRANSATLTPQDMADWMEGVIAELTLPPGSAAAAVPVADCKPKLAKAAEAGNSTLTVAALTAGVKSPAARIEAKLWCLERVVRGNFAVYRPDGARDRYLLASGDNGKAFLVQPQGSGRARYHSVNFLTAHQATIMPAQSRLPSPQRVLDMAEAKRMVTAIPTWPVQPAPVRP
ncbi:MULTISPECIES: hypothetical protein [unclassified Sphingopyxis]|uniref:hypothetical protein n=1 Tax=unclassified Sphingopyxis TaxID=2614943 RepID=UPI0007367C48|nr:MULTISPECIES: hypothetical protein [unclassified Sphingopyxis]KTE33490.1 hypothetical protein ATE62_16970 [Sphingopyxis sp. HIX]KTE83709.1 hypothetical protein ATE72_12650 [Sphingopyxis sp. HXXIV]